MKRILVILLLLASFAFAEQTTTQGEIDVAPPPRWKCGIEMLGDIFAAIGWGRGDVECPAYVFPMDWSDMRRFWD